ncbi:MAG: carboxypeptidase regulatory-like domain-containing protein [Pyrinomonadaceae bacterium]|nr:carboxypeptidase regulatory-like domain-containing protein [Chloracidobacterium sp.]MBP7416303.1 carboxypeptidase regulatory-like domain-containing protein [Pyrinomonadaceae bacterium]
MTAISLPSPPTQGNLLVAIAAGDVTGNLAAAGWSTAIIRAKTNDLAQIPSEAIFYRIAGLDQSPTFSFIHISNPDANIALQIYEFSGVNALDPFIAAATDFGTTDADNATGFQLNSGSANAQTASAIFIAGFVGRRQLTGSAVRSFGTGVLTGYTNAFRERANISGVRVPCDDLDPGCYGFAAASRLATAGGTFSTMTTFTDEFPYEFIANDAVSWRGMIAAFRAEVNITISGRVFQNGGRSVTNAHVIITDENGISQNLTSGRLGSFAFQVLTGHTYTITVQQRRFSFNARTIPVSDNVNISNLEIYSQSQPRPLRGMKTSRR